MIRPYIFENCVAIGTAVGLGCLDSCEIVFVFRTMDLIDCFGENYCIGRFREMSVVNDALI
jgi:hypothetical protein